MTFGGYEWNRITDYRSPFLFQVARGAPTPPLTKHLLFVLVDGLRDDVAHTLPAFREVGDEGSFLTAQTGQPSLSLPGWTFLTTGAPPEISGVTTNSFTGHELVDSIFREARDAGLSTDIVGTSDWRMLYRDLVPNGVYDDGPEGDTDPVKGREALRVIANGQPDLMLLYLPDVDSLSHEFGSLSPEALGAAHRASRIILRVLAAVAPDTTVMMTSDHGHITPGGHGGTEGVVRTTPFAMAGPGVARGQSFGISQGDVAPTMAALLGVPRPTHAVGSPVLDALVASSAEKAKITQAQNAVSSAFFQRAAAALGGSALNAGSFQRVEEQKALYGTYFRSPVVAVVLWVMLVVVVWATRRLDPVAIAAGVGTFVLLWLGAYFLVHGLTVSFSRFNTQSQVAAFLLTRLAEALAAGLVAGLVTGAVAGRRHRSRPLRTAVGTAAWILMIQSCIVGGVIAAYGWGFTWRLPNLTALMAEFLTVLAMAAVGIPAGAIALLGAVGGRVARIRPRTMSAAIAAGPARP